MKTKDKQFVVEIDLTRVAGAVLAAGMLAVLLWPLARGPNVAVAEISTDPAAIAITATTTTTATMRQFYLTSSYHEGNQARTACASGYHMASLWEILTPSRLVYNTSLGLTKADSGRGPPTGIEGWIRTGGESAADQPAGTANCNAWTSNHYTTFGTAVWLPSDWQAQPDFFVWNVKAGADCDCEESKEVWCVEN